MAFSDNPGWMPSITFRRKSRGVVGSQVMAAGFLHHRHTGERAADADTPSLTRRPPLPSRIVSQARA
jgi:hypothetical protein